MLFFAQLNWFFVFSSRSIVGFTYLELTQSIKHLRTFGVSRRKKHSVEFLWEWHVVLGQWFSKWSISTPIGQLDHSRGR